MIGVEFYKFGSNISKHDRYNGQGAILSLNFSRQKQGGKRKEGQTHFGSLGAFSISRTINTSLGIPCHAAPISLPLLPLLSFHPASPIFFSRSRPATNRLSSASHPNNSSFQRALSMPPLASRDAVSTSIISTNHPPRDCIPPTNQNAIYIYIHFDVSPRIHFPSFPPFPPRSNIMERERISRGSWYSILTLFHVHLSIQDTANLSLLRTWVV